LRDAIKFRGARKNIASRLRLLYTQAPPDMIPSRHAFALVIGLAIAGITQTPAQANSSVSPPTPLPGDVTVAAATGKQENVQIAKGSNTFLAVWGDTRSALSNNGTLTVGGGGPYFGRGLGTMSDIYAARLDASGNVIDQHPIVVSQASYNQGKPQVAWNGENWLVVWHQEQETNYYNYEIRGVRISAAGTVLDATPITISPPTQNLGMGPAAVVHDGANWVVIWEGVAANQSMRSVYARRISAAGGVIDPQPLAIYTHPSQYLTNPDLAHNGSGFLLTFRDMVDEKIYGQRFTQTLQPTGAKFTINNFSPSKPTHVQVASNPDGFFVVWDEHPVSGNVGSLNGCRITASGTVQDPNSIVIESNIGTAEAKPSVVWDGSRWAVAYNSEYYAPTNTYGQHDIYLKRVAFSNGAVSPSAPIRVTTAGSHQTDPALAPGTTSGAVQVVWDDARIEQDIYGAQVASNATVGSNERAVSLAAPRQNTPRMASGGNVVLTVFERHIAGSSHIYAQRLDSSGNAIDAQPFQLSANTNAANSSPSVAFNGTNFFAVWHQPQTDEFGNIIRRVYGRRVAPNGTIVDGAPFLVMEGETADVAALGADFLVVAIRRVGRQVRNVESVRVSGAGAVLGAQSILLGNYNFAPRVAALGNRWLVVWEYHSRHDASTSWIRASFVDATGAGTASFQVATSDYPYGTGNSYDDTPHLAVAGNEALIIWADNDNNTNDIKGRRIDINGTLLGSHHGFLVSSASGSQFLPAVTWDGTQYVATWVDQRDEQYPVQPRGDIYGARITRDGTLLDSAGFVVSNSAAPEETPFVTSANGKTLFTYSAFYSGAPFSALRVATRSSAFTPVTVLASVTLPENAPRGSWLTGSVTLTSAAPAGGTVVALQSAEPSVLSVPAEVTIPEGATTATFPASTHAVAADTSVVVSATSATFTRTANVLVTATSTFAQWQQVHFPGARIASDNAATADPDGDGRTNFFEYVSGSNPHAVDAVPPFTSTVGGGYMSPVYTRRIGVTDAVFTIRQSAGLTSWSDAMVADEVVTGDGVTETVTAKVPTNGAPRMFLRLHVAQQ
jgi:hypothetical protein